MHKKRGLIAGVFFLVVVTCAWCKTDHELGATASQAFDAALKGITARSGVVASSDSSNPRRMTIAFNIGGSPGEIIVEPLKKAGTKISINVARPGSKDMERELLAEIEQQLAGWTVTSHGGTGDAPKRWIDGPPRVEIRASTSAVKSALVYVCSTNGFAISSETEHQITVFKDFAAKRDLAMDVLFGNYTARAYRINIQFMIAAYGDTNVVSAASDELVQNGFGAISRIVLTDDQRAKRDIQTMLDALKKDVEVSH